MTILDRTIPNLSKVILAPLIGRDYTTEKYITRLQQFENECEKRLIRIFDQLDIQSLVKTDRYSLPYNHEIKQWIGPGSYINSGYDFKQFVRPIVKQILNEGHSNIRFYMFINIATDIKFPLSPNGRIFYDFRYRPKVYND